VGASVDTVASGSYTNSGVPAPREGGFEIYFRSYASYRSLNERVACEPSVRIPE
jgi:hypothetical protein